MKNTILVTGGAGYIGSTLVPLLLRDNCNVVVFDNLSYGGESLLNAWLYPNFAFVKGSIELSDTVTPIFGDYQIDAVVHLAGIVGDPACAKQPELARKVNLEASLRLLELSIEHGVQKFVFASTCSNYGKMPSPNGYVDEDSPLAPVSLYAELKVQVEKAILNELKRTDKFCPIVLRFATAYGASLRMRFDLTVNEFTKELTLGRELEIFGEKFWRPYCHVYDLSRAILLLLKSDKNLVAYNVFNVGDTSENYQKSMIAEEITKLIPEAKTRYIHKNEDPRDYRVSFEKIKTEIGFSTERKVPDGIKEIKQLIENRVFLNPDDSKYRNS